MKPRNNPRRRGVVLLLILGLMAMFALSVLAFMVVTSNMAQIAQTNAQIDTQIDATPQEDVGVAIKTALVGSNSERNPIGPFSILENMYGDWKEYENVDGVVDENSSVQFKARLALFPNLGIATLTPCENAFGYGFLPFDNFNAALAVDDVYSRQEVAKIFESSGSVLTFQEIFTFAAAEADDALTLWSADVANSSAFVLDKKIVNPTYSRYKSSAINPSLNAPDGQYWFDHYFNSGNQFSSNNASNQRFYWACDFSHFQVELTDELKSFIADYGPANVENFNLAQPVVEVRLNRAAFSGTGVGGFTPGETKDAQLTPAMAEALVGSDYEAYASNLRIPFAYWANAAAPDLVPFQKDASSMPSFCSLWAHLLDANYDSAQRDSTSGVLRYFDDANWNVNFPIASGMFDGAYVEPVRTNPSHTAPDFRTLFLAHFSGIPEFSDFVYIPEITPSFHRPSLFKTFSDGGYFGLYSAAYAKAGKSNEAIAQLQAALLRKLTPRPLPLDHWNFDGGNPTLALNFTWMNGDFQNSNPAALAENLGRPVDSQWDVDNDGDGVREGVWVPSGLPIRVDKNGTEFATMFSYTIIDLDGRVNVNAVGNWDQLPNRARVVTRMRAGGNLNPNEISNPYDYVDELADFWANELSGGVGPASPFFNAESLSGSFGWLDDGNNSIDVATRGAGLGPASARLCDVLAGLFEARSTYDVETVAANLLWRRNLTARDDSVGVVNQSGLTWPLDAIFNSQPGRRENGFETDDGLATKDNFFRFMNPLRLKSKVDAQNDASATIGEAKMVFPWRGKTTINPQTLASIAPAFDFADSAFRSYDPLGEQIYTYAPRYSENPYLAYQNVLSWQDSPYSLPMLERLLRPFDADASALPSQLIADLGLDGDASTNFYFNNELAAARLSLTTLSSDVPAPSFVFPENKPLEVGQYRGGTFGFADLIRRCVRAELEKVFKSKDLYLDDGYGGNAYITTEPNATVFNRKVDEITAYLVTLLPPEIAAGQKIDLNALSQKNYWLDVDYDSNGNLVSSSEVDGTALHNVGLAKRMERARGLYLVVMTLLYEDMNAGSIYNEEGAPAESKLSDYLEGSFDLLKYDEKGANEEKGKKRADLIGKELTATRIAQWCVNSIDFADPDATMTPFFFDPTPFDGWWLQSSDWIDDATNKSSAGFNRWTIGSTYTWNEQTYTNVNGWGTDAPELQFLFAPVNGVPSEQMEAFFVNMLTNSVDAQNDAASPYLDYAGNPSVETTKDSDGNVVSSRNKRGVEIVADWLGRGIKNLEDQTDDLGFRMIWGMERPDLLLTETLSFHDLGIADTDKEAQSVSGDDPATRAEGDKHFDQVKRPEGSTYLELYCAANPNVPQSPELYDYDVATGRWRLRVSKKTPVYRDSLGRDLEMPVWRVAISDSSDPRGLNEPQDGASDDDKKKLANSQGAVYRKKFNSVLERLSQENQDFSFFSMQTKQFRHLPTPGTQTSPIQVSDISKLDLYQGMGSDGKTPVEPNAASILADWKAFNLRFSNVLGPAVAAKDDGWRAREVELDRILWFAHPKGDSTNDPKKLGTAGEYPDALRTFGNQADEIVYLEPNQYLVVGPELKRALGSVAFNSSADDADDRRFGVEPRDNDLDSWLKLDALSPAGRPTPNCKYMVATAIVGGRGLNISEPLWTASGLDPYYADGGAPIDPTAAPNDATKGVRDVPFEMPADWGPRADSGTFYDDYVKNFPIVQDKLFGVGTVPAYKSAFVQRVADPNRPYHPLTNPYLSVDWNVMDLTVFTGDCVEIDGLETEIETEFVEASEFAAANNKIELKERKSLNVPKRLAYVDAFSSRQWGNSAQKAFAPTLDSKISPNVWARVFSAEGSKAGLQAPNVWAGAADATGTTNVPAMKRIPRHTLGFYNNRGSWGQWTNNGETDVFVPNENSGTTYENLNETYVNDAASVYRGAPRSPFEHLVWNDAPYSNPFELALVPASAPGRFGLEFVRTKDSATFALDKLYKYDKDKRGSLGSFGIYGFDKWYRDDPGDGQKDLKNKGGCVGPYLNFFASSKKPGETLDLCRVFEFAYTPSLFIGTRRLAGTNENGYTITDNNGNPVFHSARRDPGKININTATNFSWQAIAPTMADRFSSDARQPSTTWSEFADARYAATMKPQVDDAGNPIYDEDGNPLYQPVFDMNGNQVFKPFAYFQPPHTLGLWTQLDGTPAPIPTFTTLLTHQNPNANDQTDEEEPLFDNVKDRYKTEYGETIYADKDGNETTWSQIVADGLNSDDFHPVVTGRRNNLFEATAEIQRLSGLTTTRSNVFALWVTVGYFEVERCEPGVNMPDVDPDGNRLNVERLINANDKWYHYYQAIYPDGYTYGKELGSEFSETKRRRGFAIIDRSVPVDFRRGNSLNWNDAILLQRILD